MQREGEGLKKRSLTEGYGGHGRGKEQLIQNNLDDASPWGCCWHNGFHGVVPPETDGRKAYGAPRREYQHSLEIKGLFLAFLGSPKLAYDVANYTDGETRQHSGPQGLGI